MESYTERLAHLIYNRYKIYKVDICGSKYDPILTRERMLIRSLRLLIRGKIPLYVIHDVSGRVTTLIQDIYTYSGTQRTTKKRHNHKSLDLIFLS